MDFYGFALRSGRGGQKSWKIALSIIWMTPKLRKKIWWSRTHSLQIPLYHEKIVKWTGLDSFLLRMKYSDKKAFCLNESSNHCTKCLLGTQNFPKSSTILPKNVQSLNKPQVKSRKNCQKATTFQITVSFFNNRDSRY
jgi:hypothetical protein